LEEIIYKLNDWTIIKIVGGLGVVISAIILFLNKLTIEKLKTVWNKNAQKDLQEIKSNLAQNNSTLASLQMNYVQHQQNTQIKRIEAIEKIWEAVLNVHQRIPSPVKLALSILKDDEINNKTFENLEKNGKSLGKLISKLHPEKDTLQIVQSAGEIEYLRPFINEELYTLFKTYTVVIGRISLNFIWHFHEGKLQTWKKDEIVEKQLKIILTEKEFNYLFEKDCAFVDMVNLLEIKILEKIRETVTGAELNIDTITQMKRLEDIWKMEQTQN
jgi:hypothetical protein